MKQFYQATRISVPLTQRQREGKRDREKKKTAERWEKRVARNEMMELPPNQQIGELNRAGYPYSPLAAYTCMAAGGWNTYVRVLVARVCVFAQREAEEIRNELRAIRIASNARPPVLFR